MIKRGPSNNKRVHARNIIHKQAQARMDETVAAYNNQVSNSLAVNAVGIILYQVERLVGRPCTCSKTNVPIHPGSTEAPVIPHKDRVTDTIDIEMQDDDLFGSDFSQKIMNDDVVVQVSGGRADSNEGLVAVTTFADDEDDYQDGVSQGSINCGICYRSLRQPGYQAYGLQRRLFTNYDIENIDGFHVDSTSAPHAFVKEIADAYVCFKLLVPKYFNSATYSVREDLFILRDRPCRKDGKALTIEDLRQHAGTTIDFYVHASRFTHVLFEFDLGIQRINANIGGETTTLDYDRLQTMSDIPIVLGPEVSEVNEGDIVCIPERNLYLKIRDKERKIMQDQARLEWVCSTRVLQPTEPLRNIAKGYKLR
jgi:hypothetical protein